MTWNGQKLYSDNTVHDPKFYVRYFLTLQSTINILLKLNVQKEREIMSQLDRFVKCIIFLMRSVLTKTCSRIEKVNKTSLEKKIYGKLHELTHVTNKTVSLYIKIKDYKMKTIHK